MRPLVRQSGLALAGILASLCVGWWFLIRFPRSPVPQLVGTVQREIISVGGRERSFVAYVPARLPPHPPLLIAFHGSGETGAEFRWHTGYDFDRLADANGFIVVYPNGFEHHWNDCRKVASYSARRLQIDDIGFVRALIAHFLASQGIDPARVFATGHSNGGQMAYRVALEMPDEVRAIAAISASLPVPDNNDCRESGKPVRVLLMNGTQDPLNPWGGGRVTIFGFGDRGVVQSSEDTARHFAERDGVASPPVVDRLPGDSPSTVVERSKWGDQVELVTIRGGGHVVPQPYTRYPLILGRTVRTFDGPAEIWKFFAGGQ
jgi:polyhydroxybutyrate depolymerase